jgi:YHS domain-containing protein
MEGTMAVDIVCKRTVDEKEAIKTMYGDRDYYFCSKKCEMDFVGNPIRYVEKSQASASQEGTPTLTEDGKKKPFSHATYN